MSPRPHSDSTSTIVLPRQDETTSETTDGGWIVTVFNNSTNTYEEVITILIAATMCTPEEAWIETWEIDHLGSSVVHHACEKECTDVAKTIATIGIKVEVSEG